MGPNPLLSYPEAAGGWETQASLVKSCSKIQLSWNSLESEDGAHLFCFLWVGAEHFLPLGLLSSFAPHFYTLGPYFILQLSHELCLASPSALDL